MRVRHAEPADYKRVKELLVSERMTEDDFFTKKRFERSIKINKKYSFVAEDEFGEVLGFVTGFDDGGAFYGYMGRLVVDPAYRKHGIGTALSKKCIDAFDQNGIPIVFLGIHKGNAASEDLYKKLGAKDGGYRLFYIENG